MALDPYVRRAVQENLIGQGNPYSRSQSGWAQAFGGLAQILAQRGLSKSAAEIAKIEEEQARQQSEQQVQALAAMGVDPQKAAALNQIQDPAIKQAMIAQMMRKPDPVDPMKNAIGQMDLGSQALIQQLLPKAASMTPESQQVLAQQINEADNFARGVGMGPVQPLDVSKIQMQKKGPSEIDKLAKLVAADRLGRSDAVQEDEQGNLSAQSTAASDNAIQSDIRDLEAQLERLDEIPLDDADDLLTYQGKAKTVAAEVIAGIGGMAPDFAEKWADERLDRSETMQMQVMQLFDKYRMMVTGAAAATSEIERLEKNFVSMRKKPAQMRAAVRVIRGNMLKEISRLRDYLKEGYELGRSEEESRRLFQENKRKEFEAGKSPEELAALRAQNGGNLPYGMGLIQSAENEALGQEMGKSMVNMFTGEEAEDEDPLGLFE